ncbi:MAG: cation transporter [Clostridia bacterium]|nr:cation transporter [Clostridia bacterium]MDY3784414.1 cation transporter [Eubacteriales bacterium]
MKKVFLLEGLDCANCAAKIEKAVSELDGVKSASVNFITTKLTIETEEDTVSDEFLKKIKKTAKKTDSDVTVKEL